VLGHCQKSFICTAVKCTSLSLSISWQPLLFCGGNSLLAVYSVLCLQSKLITLCFRKLLILKTNFNMPKWVDYYIIIDKMHFIWIAVKCIRQWQVCHNKSSDYLACFVGISAYWECISLLCLWSNLIKKLLARILHS